MSTRLHRSEVNHQLGRIFRAHGVSVSPRDLAKHLGYPLAEASIADLRGIIAGLSAVVDAPRVERSAGGAGGAEGDPSKDPEPEVDHV